MHTSAEFPVNYLPAILMSRKPKFEILFPFESLTVKIRTCPNRTNPGGGSSRCRCRKKGSRQYKTAKHTHLCVFFLSSVEESDLLPLLLVIMMKSVALSESFFVHSDDNDYVVVDVPAIARQNAVVDIMTSIYDEGNDDSSTEDDFDGKNADDASYDYCDEFLAQVKLPNEPNSGTSTSSNKDGTDSLRVVPFEVELSFVADDDVGSVCPPSIAEDDADIGCMTERGEEQVSSMSDLSTSMIVV